MDNKWYIYIYILLNSTQNSIARCIKKEQFMFSESI